MTNREAKGILVNLEAGYRDLDPLALTDDGIRIVNERIEAVGVAISALEKQDAPDTNVGDTISRQAAIDVIEAGRLTKLIDAETAVNGLKALPSVQPEGIPLEWIDKHLEWLDNCDNDFAQLAKVSIRGMVEIWKKDRT